MQPYELLLLLAIPWVLTHFWLIPLVQKSFQAADLSKTIARAGTLTVLEKLRDLCGAGTVAVLLLILVVAVLNVLGDATGAPAKGVIEFLSSLHALAKSFAANYGLFLAWLGAIAAAVALMLAARKARQKVVGAWLACSERIRQRVTSDLRELNDFADDPELGQPVSRLAELLHLLDDAEQHGLTAAQVDAIRSEVARLINAVCLELGKRELNVEEALGNERRSVGGQPDSVLLRALASRRLSRDLGLLSRPLSMVITGLLLVSLTGWAASPLAQSLQLAVNNLRTQALHEDVERELETAISGARPEDQDVEEVDGNDDTMSASRIASTTQLIARVTVRQISTSAVLERSVDAVPAKAKQSEFVRAAILGSELDQRRGATAGVRAQVAREVHDGTLRVSEDLLTEVEHDVRPHIERLEAKNPRLVERLRRTIEARYGTAMNPLDAQGNLITQMVSRSLGIGGLELDNEVAKQGRGILEDVGRKAVSTWAKAHAKGLVTESLIERARPDVLKALNSDFSFELSPATSRSTRAILLESETGWLPSSADALDERMTREVAQRVASHAPKAERVAIQRTLGGYSELFPRVLEGALQGISAVGDSVRLRSPATSFRLASRSFRVRGVLFGQDLASAGLNATDLRWQFLQGSAAPKRMSLDLVTDGEQRDLGSFPAGIINQAVRYAADQRVVATTIAPGDGRMVMRVTHVHPVLRDTPLGCRIVEADRFIDTFSVGSEVDSRLRRIAQHRRAMGYFLQVAGIAERIAAGPGTCPAEQIQEHLEPAASAGFPPGLRDSMQAFFDSGLDAGRGDAELLERSLTCAANDPDIVGACLCDSFSTYTLPFHYWFSEDHTSQFREGADRLDSDLSWLERTADHFGHIDLWIHTTFALRSLYEELSDEASATPLDFPQEQLETLNKVLVDDLIPPYLDSQLHMTAQDFMGPVEDFLILQRLMRAAFSGQLGDHFPVEQLIDLEAVTRPYVAEQPTIRWEPNPEAIQEFLQVLTETGEEALDSFRRSFLDMREREERGLPRCAAAAL